MFARPVDPPEKDGGDLDRMRSEAELGVIHLFPHSARAAGGHTSAITTFIEAQLHQGMRVQGLCPLGDPIPAGLKIPIEHLPIREVDFDAPEFCARALDLVAGCRRPIFHFTGITRPFAKLAKHLDKAAIRYIVTSQGQLHFHGPVHWLKKFVYLNLASGFVRNAGGLHFLTNQEKERCQYLLPRWRKPVLVQNNLFSVPDPAQTTSVPREQLGIPARSFVFVFMGRLHVEVKGLDFLMKAFARVSAHMECHLLLVGPDHAGGQRFLDKLARRLKCDNRVHFLGPQYGQKKWEILKMADAFVSPSRWEGFGIAQAEAIGFGIPTVVSATMNLAPELLQSEAALVAPLSSRALADTMLRLMTDEPLRRSLSDCGRQWAASNCSIQTAGVRFEEFYLKVLNWETSPQ